MTLIEALVALALLALLAVGIASAFRFGQHSYRRTINNGSVGWDIATAQAFVRRIIESANLIAAMSADGTRHYGLEGTAQGLFISAAMTQGMESRGLLRYELILSPRADGLHNWIVRTHLDRDGASALPISAIPPGVHEEVLLEGIKAVRLRYLDDADSDVIPIDPSTRWRESWQGHVKPPLLVSVSVEFTSSDRRVWPTLFAIPRATERAGCEFDPVSQACREPSP